MYCIILCGGSGTRLWPLSRKNFPKQFLKLYSDKSLLQETFLRMKEVVPQENIYFVTNEENQYNVLNQIKEVYEDFKESRVIREPKSLDTMPAITLAVKYLQEIIKIDEMAPIIEVHSDHYIGDKENYVKIAKNALSKVKNNLGAIGIIPTMAHTGLGYIKKGEKIDDYFKVEAFKKSPTRKPRKNLWTAGNISGMRECIFLILRLFPKSSKDMFRKFIQLFRKAMKIFALIFQIFRQLPSMWLSAKNRTGWLCLRGNSAGAILEVLTFWRKYSARKKIAIQNIFPLTAKMFLSIR
jgi:mannose-1-phosphate guanylyltransferase/mannose-6-phosphate isomerase